MDRFSYGTRFHVDLLPHSEKTIVAQTFYSTDVSFHSRSLAYKIQAVRMRRMLAEHYVYHYLEYGSTHKGRIVYLYSLLYKDVMVVL